jgi:hypothetical protein
MPLFAVASMATHTDVTTYGYKCDTTLTVTPVLAISKEEAIGWEMLRLQKQFPNQKYNIIVTQVSQEFINKIHLYEKTNINQKCQSATHSNTKGETKQGNGDRSGLTEIP